MLGAALRPSRPGADEPADDTAGHIVGVLTLPAAGAALRQVEAEQVRQQIARFFGL